MAQACHFRVATEDAKVGQPEVLLGIIPGAGGTQRLPRSCGAELALEMCTDGKAGAGAESQAAGIVDAIVDGDLLDGAIAFAKAKAAAQRDPQGRATSRSAPSAVGAGARGVRGDARSRSRKPPKGMRRAVRRRRRHRSGPDAGLRRRARVRERELFADCVVSTESKALRHLFFAEREVAKVPDVPKDTPTNDIKRAAVVGAGTMGGGIAMTYANAGIPVLLKDVDDAALQRGLATIRKQLRSRRCRRAR